MSEVSVDFQAVKQAATADHVIRFLNLQLKQQGDTWRGSCPICKSLDKRAFVITTSKRLYHCFKCKADNGGDMLRLVSVVKGISLREGAIELAKFCGVALGRPVRDAAPEANGTVTVPPSPAKKGFDAERYAAGLDPAHEALASIGVSPETYKLWKAGFSPTGVNRGRLALAIYAADGSVVGYCGRALSADQEPSLAFPNGLSPTEYLFGIEHVTDGELILVRDPIDVLKASENGIGNVVCFLTNEISSAQLANLAGLMNEKRIEALTIM